MTAMALRKSLRKYGSHLNRQQRRQWMQFRLDQRHLLHPVHAPSRGVYNPCTGARLS